MRIDLTIPRNWNEVAKEQLAIIASLMNEQLTREEMLFVLFCRMTGLRYEGKGVFLTADKKRIRLETWQLSDFCGRLAFVLDTLPCDIVNPTRVNSYLDDITFGDYFHADSLVYGYRLEGNPDMVRRALGDLGDHRRGVSKQFANEVMLWWAGVQQWLKSQYPLVLEDSGSSAEPYDPLKARQNIMLMLNNDNPRDNEHIEQSKMHDVFAALQSKIEHAKQREEQMKRHGQQ
ncbi:MAG: hypothetical protein IJ057_06340 [Bacteroidales bacterium]|nr:hypothetical protein [Bacteroidales bacterium]